MSGASFPRRVPCAWWLYYILHFKVTTYTSSWSGVITEKLTVPELPKYSSHFTQLEVSVSVFTCVYPDPDNSNPHPLILYKVNFYIIIPSRSKPFKFSISFRFPPSKPPINLSFPLRLGEKLAPAVLPLRFEYPHLIGRTVQVMELFNVQFSSFFRYFPLY